jgi:hypothetical protein
MMGYVLELYLEASPIAFGFMLCQDIREEACVCCKKPRSPRPVGKIHNNTQARVFFG